MQKKQHNNNNNAHIGGSAIINQRKQCKQLLPVILSRTSLQDSISPMLPNKLFSSSWVMF